MRRLIYSLIILAAAVWAGVKIAGDPGYVLLAYQDWTIEMPLWFTVIALILTFIVLYLFLRLIKNILRLPRKIRMWSARRRARINQRMTHQGLLALSMGAWVDAEKKLIKATTANPLAWLNYLAAARAAYERGDKEKREYYLEEAIHVTPAAEIAVGIEQFHFRYEQQQFEQALAVLQRVYQLAPKQNYVLRLLLRLCVRLQEWQAVLNLLPAARKQKALPIDKLNTIEVQAQTAVLQKLAMQDLDLPVIQNYWDGLSRELQHTPALLFNYANLLVSKNEISTAEKLLRNYLSKDWDFSLVNLYGLLNYRKPDEQLKHAEKWLQTHANDPVLLLALGRICVRNQLWGKARSYLETSIAFAQRPETYFELGKLFEKLNETTLAFKAYKDGLDNNRLMTTVTLVS